MSDLLAFGAIFAALAAPVVLVILLFRVALRRFSGRHGKYDSLFEGMGRAAATYSHLVADMPDPDDVAVPKTKAPPPGGGLRRRGAAHVTFDRALDRIMPPP